MCILSWTVNIRNILDFDPFVENWNIEEEIYFLRIRVYASRFNYTFQLFDEFYSIRKRLWVFIFNKNSFTVARGSNSLIRWSRFNVHFFIPVPTSEYEHSNDTFGFFKFQFQSPVKRFLALNANFHDVAQPIFSPRHLVNTFSLPHFLVALVYPLDRRSIYLTANFRGTNEDHPFFTTFFPSPRKSNRFHIRKNIDWIAR